MDLENGQRFSHYVIQERLGHGGMGVVYKAQDLRLKRTVALKLLLRKQETEGELQRFLREAESSAALNHPRLAHVYEVDEQDGVLFIAMEYLPGGSVRDRIARERASIGELLQWCSEVAEALAEAHRHDIVHRDVKPANILLDAGGHAKLADFGLARRRPRSAEAESRLTTDGIIVGTPNYMSPEHALGLDVGPPSDVFSLGCVLYELGSDSPPFRRGNTLDTLHATAHEPAPSLPEGEFPAGLPELIARMLVKDPGTRPTALEVSQELREIARIRPEPSEAETFVVSRRAAAPAFFRKRLVTAALLTAAGLVLIGGLWFWRRPLLDFEERETVVIGGIVNSTGEAVLEDSLETALQISLEQSRYVNVLSPDRVRQALKRMRKSEDEKLTDELAREICQREGARALLTGGVARLGDNYVLSVRIVDPSTGSTVRTLTERTPTREEILPALDRLSETLRRALGESLESIDGASLKLAEATTSSLEALQLFTEGKALQGRGRVKEARELFERALELDSEFARAYAGLATTYRSFGISYDDVLAERNFQEALKRLDKVGERERLEIQGLYNGVLGRYEEAARYYRLLVERYPTVDEYHVSLARQYTGLSRYPEAIFEFEEARRLNPRSAGILVNLAAAYGSQGQYSQEVRTLEAAFLLEPDWETDDIQNHQYGWALLLTGEEARARAAFEKMLAQGGGKKARGHRSLGILALYRGEFEEAAVQLEQAAHVNEGASALNSSARDLLYLAEGLALAGHNQQALRYLGQAVAFLEKNDYQPAWLGFRISVIYSRLGNSAEAARLMSALQERSPSPNRMDQVDAMRAEGELLLARGSTEEGVEILRRSHATWPSELTRTSLARALAQTGRREEALERYRDLVAGSPMPWEAQVEWVLAHVTLGRLYEESGQEDDARAAYLKFLEIWKDADSDLPLLSDVRRRLGARIELR